ncbi:phage major tail tube protein [Bartonella ancashensis]|uniref:Phage major tail tube protein n=1 Tax=Bartonella ancashensis TaxID=1318743 RepID=A0A0M4LRK9_9HYPH|nr:phage major tail tube protein [Bartonella ancashensis]ALE02859.1 Phage major tail tube protein [Bartonella ancashensis]
MIILPKHLKYLNIYVDGIPYQGKCESVTLPTLNLVVESHRACGMDIPIEIDMGMEPLTLNMVVSGYSPELIGALGKTDVRITLRGSVQAQGEPAESVEITMNGLCKSSEINQWQSGSAVTCTLNYTLHYFKYIQKDVEVVEIDAFNMVRRINGVDQLEQHRKHLGF